MTIEGVITSFFGVFYVLWGIRTVMLSWRRNDLLDSNTTDNCSRDCSRCGACNVFNNKR